MTDAIEHEAAIATGRVQTEKRATVADFNAMSALVKKLEAEAEENRLEIERLSRIEEEARCAYRYHLAGRPGTAEYDEFWEANDMIERLDRLGEALAK